VTPAPVAVRPAEPADAPAVLALWETSRTPHSSTPDTPEGLALLFAADPGSLLLAEADRDLVGTLIAAWDGWRGNMYRLAVRPDWRRRGVARELVRAGEARLRARGARRITALVVAADEVATSLWASVGFAFDEDVARFVRNLD
jgi:ribosomal protein S18 acetylase RimI-like enzyme